MLGSHCRGALGRLRQYSRKLKKQLFLVKEIVIRIRSLKIVIVRLIQTLTKNVKGKILVIQIMMRILNQVSL